MPTRQATANTLCFVGDFAPSCFYSQDVETLAQSLKELRGAIPQFATLFFNLECSLFNGSTGRDTEANEAALRTLVLLKPAVANLSNNHHFDGGLDESLRIRQILDEVGIPYVGLYDEGERGYHVVEVGTERVGVMARTARGTNPKSWGAGSYVMLPIDHAEILSTCDTLVREVDIAIVCLHWGAEYYRRPSPRQRRLVEQLVARGVDVVWGHHAHVLQARQCLGEALVMYGMGNCIFGQAVEGRWPSESKQAALVVFETVEHGQRCWEIGFDAGNSGAPLASHAVSAIRGSMGHTILWYPLSVLRWFGYRAYMELFVFGKRFIQRKLSHRQERFAKTDYKIQPAATHEAPPRVAGVIRERLRRVVSVWEDE